MIKRVINEEQTKKLKQLIADAKNIVITCHMSPDGDAVGSSLGLMHVLRTMGKYTSVVTPDMVPVSLNFLPGVKSIVVYTRQELLAKQLVKEADLIICLDFNALYRIDRFAPVIGQAKATKVMIDHHLDPENFTDLCISYPHMSSTCELLYNAIVLTGMKRFLNYNSATCIYTGMMTDTGNFTYNSNNSDLYIIIAELLKYGIDKDYIYNTAMNTFSADRLRLMGYAMSEKMEVFPEVGGAIIELTREELYRFNYQKGDTESLVNKPLSIPGIYWSIFLREDADYIKVSARSTGDFAVNGYCEQYFSGGGHKNAAGGEFIGTIEDARKQVLQIVEDLKSNKH
ncbi:MAG: DHH family phosphoesterase [Muribaculaceae bacterium]|nr:DHH family phosphoesterase [Muribaculaceae bacterium]MEE1297751.1 DHH family phosphoesterase [Muribaculaceae bacterium]